MWQPANALCMLVLLCQKATLCSRYQSLICGTQRKTLCVLTRHINDCATSE